MSSLLLLLALLLLMWPAYAGATPIEPRFGSDQHGDFVLLGNTLAQGCDSKTPAPLVGRVSTSCGQGKNKDDTSPDAFWSIQGNNEDQPITDFSVTSRNASSQAELVLPPGARVTYARVYWAATFSNSQTRPPSEPPSEQSGKTAEFSFRVDMQPLAVKFPQHLSADATSKQWSPGADFQYQSSMDVTDFVRSHGAGLYRLGDVDAIALNTVTAEFMFSSWWMAVFYELDSEPMRHLKLYDGLDIVAARSIDISLKGFYVPRNAKDARLGVVAFDGDEKDEGDWLKFNNKLLSNAMNPENNFFNSTRSDNTQLNAGGKLAVSQAGDLPRLTGEPGSMSGLDLDVVDVSPAPGDTSATVQVGTESLSNADIFWLGGFVTSIATQRPDFSATVKTVENLSRTEGSARPGDLLRYTITTTNNNDQDTSDVSVGTTLRDPLPAGLDYVAGSLQVNGRPASDADGDDIGSCDGHTILVHLGRGATSDMGGEMGLGDSATVSFQARVASDAQGSIDNQAFINAGGKRGADPMDTPSRPALDQPSGTTPLPVVGNTPGPDAGTPQPGPDAGTPGSSPDTGTPNDDPGSRNAPEYLVAGRGCSASGGESLLWLVMLLALVPLMRPRRTRTARGSVLGGVALGSLVAATGARAEALTPDTLSQSIDVQRYKPGPGATDLLGVYGARVDHHLGWHLGASFSYANNPLGFLDKNQGGFVYEVVATQMTVDVMGSLSLWDRFELGVALPLTYQASQRGAAITPAFAQGVDGGGVGDLRLVPKAHLFSSGELHLGAVLPVLLPTAGGVGFRGGSGVAVQPQLVGEWARAGGPRVVVNLGARLTGEQRLQNLRAGNELSFALGAQVPVGERLDLQAQLAGALGLNEQDAEGRPLELLASVRYRLGDGLRVHVGGGPGLSRGYGTPGLRLFAGLDWTLPGGRAPQASSSPGPSRPGAAVSERDGAAPRSGPQEPPAMRHDQVRLESRRIAILDKIHFATGQDAILERSFELLQQVAGVLRAHPEIERVRVEGHTDDRGDEASNQSLSQHRADNVRGFLMHEGIAAGRLEAVGYGKARPVDTNQTEAGRENNRRVEFTLVKVAGGP